MFQLLSTIALLTMSISVALCAEDSRESSIDMTSMRKPLRIRVVNYDPANEPFVERYIMKKNARNYYGPHAEGTAGGTYSGRSYLREVRRRMRPGT